MTGGQDCPYEYDLKILVLHGSEEAIEKYTGNISRLGEWKGAEEQIKIQKQLLQQQENQESNHLISQTLKPCPHCKIPGVHPRGHRCHEIKCEHCRQKWCYVCGGKTPCQCPFRGHTFCGAKNGKDCGCLPCTDGCATQQSQGTNRNRHPCQTCDQDGRCPHCPSTGRLFP